MSTAMNTSAVKSIIGDTNAARVKAEEDYFAILLNAKRNSDQDKADLATAMRILDITPAQAMADQAAVVESRTHAAGANGHAEAEKIEQAAREELSEFHRTIKPAMLAEIEKIELAKKNALSDAEGKRAAILASLLKLRRHRLQHGPRLLNHLAVEPEGSPQEIRIQGVHHKPEDGPNRYTGY